MLSNSSKRSVYGVFVMPQYSVGTATMRLAPGCFSMNSFCMKLVTSAWATASGDRSPR